MTNMSTTKTEIARLRHENEQLKLEVIALNAQCNALYGAALVEAEDQIVALKAELAELRAHVQFPQGAP